MSSKNFLNIKLRQSKSVTVLKRNRVTLVPSLDIVDTFLFVVCSLHILRSLSVCSLLSSPSNKKQKTGHLPMPLRYGSVVGLQTFALYRKWIRAHRRNGRFRSLVHQSLSYHGALRSRKAHLD